jgi:hypothetical protein
MYKALPGMRFMIFLKSIVVSVTTFVAVMILYLIAFVAYVELYLRPRIPQPAPGVEVGFDLGQFAIPFWVSLLIAIAAAVAAFYWMFSRGSN